MIGLRLKGSHQKWFAPRFAAAALGLDGDENGVDLRERRGVIEFHHPAAVCITVQVKDAHAEGTQIVRTALAPCLIGAGILESSLFVEVEGVKNQRLSVRIKNSAKRLLCAAIRIDVEDVGDVEFASPH